MKRCLFIESQHILKELDKMVIRVGQREEQRGINEMDKSIWNGRKIEQERDQCGVAADVHTIRVLCGVAHVGGRPCEADIAASRERGQGSARLRLLLLV